MLEAYLAILEEVKAIKARYSRSHEIGDLKNELLAFARKYEGQLNVWDLLLNVAEEYISAGDHATGHPLLLLLSEREEQIFNQITLFLRLAEYHIQTGDTETGTRYLIRLCTDVVSNYEESIAFNSLTPVWEKYKHLVEGQVPPSIPVCSAVSVSDTDPLPPDKCSTPIREILALPGDDLLSQLSVHLGELSGRGCALSYLNKWEKAVFYTDELCMEVNSGGFDSYLYHGGTHFEKAYQALQTMEAAETCALMDRVRGKFPRGRVPKSMDAIQNALEAMEEKGIDFEDEDGIFYDTAEKELLRKLLAYVRENAKRFR